MLLSSILAVSLASLPLSGLAAPLDARHEHFRGGKNFAAVASPETAAPQSGVAHPLDQSLRGIEKCLDIAVKHQNETGANAYWALKGVMTAMRAATRIQHGVNATQPEVNTTQLALRLVAGVHKVSKHYAVVMRDVGGPETLLKAVPAQFAAKVQQSLETNLTDATQEFLGDYKMSLQELNVPVSYVNGMGNATFSHHALGINSSQPELFVARPSPSSFEGHELSIY